MLERVIWSRRYLTSGVRSANASLVPLRGHLSESVPAEYYAITTPGIHSGGANESFNLRKSV
jgi:hypothetical protein